MTPFTLEEKEIAELVGYKGPDAVVFIDEMREVLKAAPKKNKIHLSLGALDKVVDGIEAGELISIGGPTKHGKTLLAQTLTAGFSASGVKVVWFTFEVPLTQFIEQLPATVAYYVPKQLILRDIEWVFKRISEAKFKFNVDVVFIDNLHHLFDIASSRNPSLDIGVLIRQLKRIALGLNVTLFILCHSRKPSDAKGQYAEISEWDLRDSSFIPQESDSTWMVQRKMDKETKRFTIKSFVKVCNHRRTGAMQEIVHLVKVGQLLEEDVTIHE